MATIDHVLDGQVFFRVPIMGPRPESRVTPMLHSLNLDMEKLPMPKNHILGASALILGSLALAAPASAQGDGTQFYGSLGYSWVTSSDNGEDLNLGAISGKFGTRLGYLGVEGEVQFGVADDQVPCAICSDDIDVELKHDYAIYAVGFLPLNPNFDLFARIGYGEAEAAGSVGNVSVSANDSSFRWGAGGQFFFDGVNGLRAEYTNSGNLDETDFEADIFTISYTRRF